MLQALEQRERTVNMELSQMLKDRIEAAPVDIGIYVREMTAEESIFVGNQDVFPSLGIAKLVLLVEVFNQIENGKIRMDDKYVFEKKPPFVVPEEEYEENVGVLDFMHEGIELTIADLVYLMMTISDNSAFNILLSIVGMDNVNRTMKQLGMEHTFLRCMLFEWIEEEPEKDNYHSVREIGDLMYRLYNRQLISREASSEMLRILTWHQRRELLSFLSSRKISIAQQTGFDKKELHLASIIMSSRPFILCVSTRGLEMKKAESLVEDIAKITYSAVQGE